MKQKDLQERSERFKKFCYVVLTLLVVVLTIFVCAVSEFIGFPIYFPLIINALVIYIYVSMMSDIHNNPIEITKAVIELDKAEKRNKRKKKGEKR